MLPVVISNIQSTALKKYTVSWEKPSLPILKYAINYGVFNEPKNPRNISKDTTSFIVNVDYEKRYIFEIQVVAQAGISDVTSETWFSRSGIKYVTVYHMLPCMCDFNCLHFVVVTFSNIYPTKEQLCSWINYTLRAFSHPFSAFGNAD